jgi:predicted ATPase
MAEVHQKRREMHAARQQVETSLALCAEHGFAYCQIRNTILYGGVLAMHAHGEQGIAQIRQGLAAYQASGAEIFRPYYASLLAEAYHTVGDTTAGLAVINEALASTERTQEH